MSRDPSLLLMDPMPAMFMPEFNTKDGRIRFLERAMQRDLTPEDRKQIVREFLDLTNPEIQEPDL